MYVSGQERFVCIHLIGIERQTKRREFGGCKMERTSEEKERGDGATEC